MQVSKYAGYASTQVCRYAGRQVCKYASIKVCKYAIMQLCKHLSMQVCKYVSIQECKCPSMRVRQNRRKQIWEYESLQASVQLCKYTSLQVWKCQLCKHANMKVYKYATMQAGFPIEGGGQGAGGHTVLWRSFPPPFEVSMEYSYSCYVIRCL